MYLDEFQHAVRLPIDLADMLAQARGFALGLTLAHQYLGQRDVKQKLHEINNSKRFNKLHEEER